MRDEKYERLKQILGELGSVVVAFSGGTDSTLVLKVAHDVLGDGALAMTAVSASLAGADREEARALAESIGARHILFESGELASPEYQANTPNRCFFCKQATYGRMAEYAREHGARAIVDGTNADDRSDFRPGRKAAREYGVRSPLLESGFTKEEVRILARALGLPNWDKPAAACLSSRIPYGTPVSIAALSQIERAEAYLHGLGLQQVRVRHHDLVARIEAEPGDFPRLLEAREQVVASLKACGYAYVAMDLAGFRSGSLNETIRNLPSDQVS